MGVMDFFRIRPNQPAGSAQASPFATQQPGQNAAGGSPTEPISVTLNKTIPNSLTPNPAQGGNPNTAFGPGGEGDKAPLGNYLKMWEIDPNKKAPESPVPTFNADPTKMQELAATVDFTKQIEPELMARAMKGDGAALIEVVNKSAQAGFAHSNLATTKIVESALNSLNNKYETEFIPRILAAERTRNHVAEDNPIFSNPAAAPVVNLVRNQIMTQYPTASPQEIKTMVNDYLTGFSTATLGQSGLTVVDPKTQVGKKLAPMQRGETDWEKLLG